MKIVTGKEMAGIDKTTIEELGMPGPVLMENAARAACRAFVNYVGKEKKPGVVVLCGSGNNGGDGFCIARILSGWGFPVKVIFVGRIQSLKPDARLNFQLLEKYKVEVLSISNEQEVEDVKEMIGKADWIVDAIFGTGLSRQILGKTAKVLKISSQLSKKVMAVDIPSGINADNGEILGDVLKADLTVTFGLPKWGHFLFPGAGYIGKLEVADIGFPQYLVENDSLTGNITSADFVKSCLPTRKPDAHKGSCGRLAVIAGCKHFMGAAILSSKAALKSGTGYLTLFPPNYMEPYIKLAVPDIVTRGLTDMDGGFITTQASDIVLESLGAFDALAIGPGMGMKPTTGDFILDILEDNHLPVVIDADGLNHLALFDRLDRNPDAPWILTPHPGEAARLLKTDTGSILANPLESARSLAEKFNAVVVLKGANSLIVNPEGEVYVNPTGNPGMATLGMGDVLTGIISSLLARGVSPFKSAIAGVYIHGLAGDLVLEVLGEDGLTSSDVIEAIPKALLMIRRGLVEEKFMFLR